MAVSKVKAVSIIGVLPELENIINVCGKSQIFQPDNVASFYSNTNSFKPITNKNPYEEPLETLKDCVLSAGQVLKKVDVSDFNATKKEIDSYIKYMSSKLEKILLEKAKINSVIDSYKKEAAELEHFLGLDLNLDEIFACKYIKVRFGRIPKESYEKLCYYKDNSYVLFFECTKDENYYWGVYFAPVEEAFEIDRIFSGLYFERLRISENSGTPEGHIKELNDLIKDQEKLLDDIDRKIESFWKVQYNQCMRIYSKIDELYTYFTIKNYAMMYQKSFILVGWIPAENEEEFSKSLSKIYGVEYSIERSTDDLKVFPPVILKNKLLFRPFEMFVSMYGLPSYNEIDPTAFVAITYTILFGIMFGDVGQGLLLSVIGYIMWKVKQAKLGKVLVRCGISSAVFGCVFGSVFGFEHTLDPMYKSLFGMDEKPIEIMNPGTTNTIIYAAVAIGIILVVLSMILNIYSSLKRKDYENGIFGANGISGITLYVSAVVGLVSKLVLKINLVNAAYVIFLIVIPIIIILFREVLGKIASRDKKWKPEKWGEYISQNAFELFEILLSYVTNTVSFLRVGAFVLVHSGMMLVVFTLAGMTSGVGYILVVVIGNIFVMGLEALLVGIQVMRLEFYEMFSRFYKGEGRPFEPVRVGKV